MNHKQTAAPDQQVDTIAPVDPDEQACIDADLAYNAAKATHHERNDARAIYDQAMLNTLMGSSL